MVQLHSTKSSGKGIAVKSNLGACNSFESCSQLHNNIPAGDAGGRKPLLHRLPSPVRCHASPPSPFHI